MPRPDPIGGAPRSRPDASSRLRKWLNILGRKRRRPGKDLDEGGVPVEPDRPSKLDGGAAAPLDFDDEPA